MKVSFSRARAAAVLASAIVLSASVPFAHGEAAKPAPIDAVKAAAPAAAKTTTTAVATSAPVTPAAAPTAPAKSAPKKKPAAPKASAAAAPALPGVAKIGDGSASAASVAAPAADPAAKPAAVTPAAKAAAPAAKAATAAKATSPAAPAPAVAATPASATKPAAAAAGSAAASATPAAPAPSAEAEAVWHSYEKRWSETEDYAAGFRQTIEVPDIGSKVESAGRFYFVKPGLVRWEYTEGPPQTVVGDGTWIWLYQPDLQQVYKIPYAKAFGRGGLVELLAGREGVSERYTTALERPDASTVKIFLKSKSEGGGDLEVTLAAETFDLKSVTVHDAAGSTTRMTFAEPQRNRGADRKRFTFTPPAGVDIISDNETGF